MKFCRFSRIIHLFLVFFSLSVNIFGSIRNIKDTYSALPDKYKALSLVHGAVAWESGQIRRMYDFGKVYPVIEQSNGRNEIVRYEKENTQHSTIRLIHTLFHRVPGTRSNLDFMPTNSLQANTPSQIAEKCANILILMKKIEAQQSDIYELFESIMLDLNDKTNLKNFLKEPSDQSLYEKFKADTEIKQYISRNRNDGQTIENFQKNLCALDKEFKRLLNLRIKPKSYVQLVLNAFEESNLDALYCKNMPYTIVLAFFYKKCGHDRSAIQSFYNTILSELDEATTNNTRKRKLGQEDIVRVEKISRDGFQETTPAQAYQGILVLTATKTVEENIESFIYYVYNLESFCPASYLHSQFEYTQGKHTKAFPDCMETTIRNFVSALCYNFDTGVFNTEILKKTIGKNVEFNLNQHLETFFAQHKEKAVFALPETFNHWNKVISDIPFASYQKIVNIHTGVETTAGENSRGYIKIPQETPEQMKNWLICKGYILTPSDCCGFELKPSAKNVIIILDHLLNLSILGKEKIQAFLQEDFVQAYLPAVASALKMNLTSKTENNHFFGDVESIKESAFLEICFKSIAENTQFNIVLTKQHADLELNHEKNKYCVKACGVLMDSDTESSIHLLNLVMNNLLQYELDIDYKDFDYTDATYGDIFILNFENMHSFYDLQDNIFKMGLSNCDDISMKIALLETYKKVLQWHEERLGTEYGYFSPTHEESLLFKYFFSNISTEKINADDVATIQKDSLEIKAINLAMNAIVSENINTFSIGIDLLEKLISLGFGEDEVLSIINTILSNPLTDKQPNIAIKLITILFSKKPAEYLDITTNILTLFKLKTLQLSKDAVLPLIEKIENHLQNNHEVATYYLNTKNLGEVLEYWKNQA